MANGKKHKGMSLIEMTLVVAAVAVVATFSVPAIDTMLNSLDSPDQTKAMIDSALAAARAGAMKHHQYVGVRFQHANGPQDDDDVLEREQPQYMVFIIHDPEVSGGSSSQDILNFRAFEGNKPIKLPDTIGVFTDNSVSNLIDESTFSIVFSPSGKLIVVELEVLEVDNDDAVFTTSTSDIDDGLAMFYDDTTGGLSEESSVRKLVIYNRKKFRKMGSGDRDDYLDSLKENYVSPYTGKLFEVEQ